jgi:hypothetical protein
LHKKPDEFLSRKVTPDRTPMPWPTSRPGSCILVEARRANPLEIADSMHPQGNGIRACQRWRPWRCRRRSRLREKIKKLFQFASSAQSESLALRLPGNNLIADGIGPEEKPHGSLKWFKAG